MILRYIATVGGPLALASKYSTVGSMYSSCISSYCRVKSLAVSLLNDGQTGRATVFPHQPQSVLDLEATKRRRRSGRGGSQKQEIRPY